MALSSAAEASRGGQQKHRGGLVLYLGKDELLWRLEEKDCLKPQEGRG